MEITNGFVDIGTLKPNKFKELSEVNVPKTDDKLRAVCDDFEAFFMNQILETSLKSTNVAGEGTGSDIIKGMYTDSLSRNSSGSLGISDMLYTFLSENKK